MRVNEGRGARMSEGLVIKLSGSVVEAEAGEIDVTYVAEFADALAEACQDMRIAVTIGGGGVARRYIRAARELGETDSRASLLGGDLGYMNCKLVIAALRQRGVAVAPSPLDAWDDACRAVERGEVPVLCGWWPGLTSDSVAVYFADYASINYVLKLSRVDAIYDHDPDMSPVAMPHRELTHAELCNLVAVSDERSAGAHGVLDIVAVRRLEKSGIGLLFAHKNRLREALIFARDPSSPLGTWGTVVRSTGES